MPIALLKYPNDLLQEVFMLCNPFELYKLSKCSKKCSQRSITLRGTKNWKISFLGENDISVSVDDSNYHFHRTNIPACFKTKFRNYISEIDIEFPNGGGVDLFVYLIEIFGIRTVKLLRITSANCTANISKAAKVLFDRNMEIEEFVIGNFEEVQDVLDFMPMLSQINIIQDFICSLEFPPSFQFEFAKYPRKVLITDSSWFTIDQLLDCTCSRINLTGSSFNNHDLDVFLQKWKETEMIPPIATGNIPRIRVIIRDNFNPGIVDVVRITKDDGTEGWLNVKVGSWPELNFLIADPTDTLVEEIPNHDNW